MGIRCQWSPEDPSSKEGYSAPNPKGRLRCQKLWSLGSLKFFVEGSTMIKFRLVDWCLQRVLQHRTSPKSGARTPISPSIGQPTEKATMEDAVNMRSQTCHLYYSERWRSRRHSASAQGSLRKARRHSSIQWASMAATILWGCRQLEEVPIIAQDCLAQVSCQDGMRWSGSKRGQWSWRECTGQYSCQELVTLQ